MGLCLIRADVAYYFWICHFFVANGNSSFGIKYIVLVPYIQCRTPWVKRPNLLASDFVQIYFQVHGLGGKIPGALL